MSNRYQNGKIYKVININEPDKFYVGSTCNPLCKRMVLHRSACKKESDNRKFYISMREEGIENFKIILIENYPCDSKDELRAREQYYIEQLNPVFNMKSAYSTEEHKKQYYEANKEQIKQYYEANNEQIKQQKKQYYKLHREEILKRKKEYREAHKEEFNERQKKYRENKKKQNNL